MESAKGRRGVAPQPARRALPLARLLGAVALVAMGAVACARPDPVPTPSDAGSTPPDGGGCAVPPPPSDELGACRPLATDYQPRVDASANDAWPACISDDGVYHPINPSISTIARVAAFDELARMLWANDGGAPSAADFLEARVLFAQDQGLGSRVERREDIHFDAAPQPCSTQGIPESYPDRCAGPAKLLPVLTDAFARGASGEAPRLHAARIEAALVWFLYLSSLSEATSCATKPQDCDSAWAYYCGGTERDAPAGLARIMRAHSELAHQRAYDATLAVRCWRNLDNETATATDLALRDRARSQLDVALLRGVALVVRQRFALLACATGDVRDAARAFLDVLLPLVDRAARERSVSHADTLRAQAARPIAEPVDGAAAIAALDALFPCP